MERTGRLSWRRLARFWPVAFGVIAALLFLVRAHELLEVTGHWKHLGRTESFFSADGREYGALAEYLAGRAESVDPKFLELRPIGYPLFLTLHFVLGIAGFQILQIVFVAISLGALTTALVRRAGPLLGLLPLYVFWNTRSAVFLALHALTETFALALGCWAIVALSKWFEAPRNPRVAGLSLALLCGLTLAKPVFQPALFVALGVAVFLAVRELRASGRAARPFVLGVTLGVLPLFGQYAFTTIVNGRPSVSNASTLNFGWRFFPAVAGAEENGDWRSGKYKSDFAKRIRKETPELRDRLAYVLDHPRATREAYTALLLDEHLLARSNEIEVRVDPEWRPSRAEKKAQLREIEASRVQNQEFAWLHVWFLPIVLFTAVRCRREPVGRITLATWSIAASVILTAPLVYFQGDRVIVAAAPFWSTAYALSLAPLWSWVIERVRSARRRAVV